MDKRKPIQSDRPRAAGHGNHVRAGFGVAPILYMLGLIGVGAGILFSSYSQTLKTNMQMTNSLAVKSDLDASATTLAATSVLGSSDASILCPPQGGAASANCAGAPDKITDFYPSANVTAGDVHLPGPANYASVATTGATGLSEAGVFTPGAGVKQLDPWGHYYIYCRWESAANSNLNPSIEVISAGPDGILQTPCGATTASGDDIIVRMDAANAVNRASVWQVGTVGTSGVPDVHYGINNGGLSVDENGNLTVPGNITVNGSYNGGTAGNGSIAANAFYGSVVGGTIAGTTGTFSGAVIGSSTVTALTDLSAENNAFYTGVGGSVTASNGAFTLDSSGNLAIGSTAFTVTAATGDMTVAGSSTLTGQVALGSSMVTIGTVDIGTAVVATGSSTPLLTVGKKVGLVWPFSVDQYGNVFAGSGSTIGGNLSGTFSGGVTASSFSDSSTASISGLLSGSNATFTGTVTAQSFNGSMTIGSGGVSITGVLPITNGGTGASDAADALNNLGVTSGGYLNTALLEANLIPGADLVSGSVGTSQLSPTGVAAGTYTSVTVDATGRVTSGTFDQINPSQISDGNGDIVAVGTSAGVTFTVGSTEVGNWTTTGLMVGTSTAAKNKLDVYGASAIGTSYAGVDTAPANGLIVVGSVGIGTSNPVSALQVLGTVTAGSFSGDGSGLTGIGTGSITGTVGTGNGGTGTNTTFTQGSVVYAGTSGIYAQDNANFYYNAATHSLGIRTAAPANALDVNGSLAVGAYAGVAAGASNELIVGGNVGIGTTSPIVSLDLSQQHDAIALPVGDNSTRPANGNVTDGEIRYNSSIPAVEARVNGAWTAFLVGGTGGSIGVTQGGTGDTTLTAHAVLVGEGTSPVASVGPGPVDSVLVGLGSSADPAFSTTPTVGALTVAGVEAVDFGTDYATAGTQIAAPLSAESAVRYTGGGAATFQGIAAGASGQILYLHNASGSILTLSNQNGAANAANRIITGSGADLQMAANSSVTLQYDGMASLWRVIGGSGNGNGIPAGTTGQIQFNSGNNTFAADANLYWDNIDKWLGIGSQTPAYPVDVSGTMAANRVHVYGQSGGAGGIGGAGAGSNGYVQFDSGGALAGSANFFWNNTAAELGIGTSSPVSSLDVEGVTDINVAGSPAASLGGGTPELQVNEGAGIAESLVRATNDSYGANLVFQKTRGANATILTAVQNGDALGQIVFGGADGGAWQWSAQIKAVVDGTVSSGIVPTDLVFNTGATGYGSESMRITSAGDVGVGTSAPHSMLQIYGGEVQVGSSGNSCIANTAGAISYSGGVLSYCDGANSTWEPLTSGISSIGTGQITGTLGVTQGGTGTNTQFTPGSVVFAGANGVYTQDNSQFFWDDTNHFLGIGTASPSSLLELASDTTGSFSMIKMTRSGNLPAPVSLRSSGGTNASPTALLSGNQIGVIGATGYMGSGFTSTPSATLRFVATENFSNTDQGGAITFETTPNGSTTSGRLERMRIDNTGFVGIGTTSPATNLDVNGSIVARSNNGGTQAAFLASATGNVTYAWNATGAGTNAGIWDFLATGTGGNSNLYLRVLNDSQSWTATPFQVARSGSSITSVQLTGPNIILSGNVGIGTTSPGNKLDVESATQYAGLNIGNGTHTIANIIGSSSGNDYGNLGLYNAGVQKVSITADPGLYTYFNSGNIGIGTATPSQPLTIYGNVDASSGSGYLTEITNSTATAAHLAKLNTSGATVIGSTTDTDGMVGIVVGTTAAGNAQVAVDGQASCTFENATTAGDFVIIGTTTAGDCRDSGSTTRPTSGQVIGRVLSGVSAGSSAPVELGLNGAGGNASGLSASSGTTNYVARWTPNGTTLGTGTLYDNGTAVGIGTAAPQLKLHVSGGASGGHPTWAASDVALVENIAGTASYIEALSDTANGIVFSTPTTRATGYLLQSQSGNYVTLANSNTGGIITFNTVGAERMRIDNAGNVGIGTTAPTAKLSIGSPALSLSAASTLFNTNAGSLSGTAGTDLVLASIGFTSTNQSSLGFHAYRVATGTDWTTTAIGLGMDVDNTTRAGANIWLYENGDVGIGTTSPAFQLDVQGSQNVRVGSPSLYTVLNGNQLASVGGPLYFNYGSAQNVLLETGGATGNVGIGTASPSQPLTIYGNVDASSGSGYLTEITNSTATAGHLAKLNTSGAAVIGTTGDTDGMVGIVVGTTTAGNAQIAVDGQASCTFENATTAGDFVTIGTGTAGDCRDAGTSRSTTAQTIGRVLSSVSLGSSAPVELGLNGAGGNASGISASSGATNYVARWTAPTTLGTGTLYDNGTQVGIGTSSPSSSLDVVAIGTGGNAPLLTVENTSGATPGAFGPGIILNNHVASTNPFVIDEFQNAASFFTISNVNSPYQSYFAISQAGNVGIGTTGPNGKLSIGNNVYAAPLGGSYGQYQLILYDGGSASNSFGMGVEGWNMGFNSSGGYKFYQNGGSTPIMVIGGQSSGNVGIGTTGPSNLLDAYGDGTRIASRSATSSGVQYIEAQAYNYWSGTSYTGTSIRQNGSATTGTTVGVSNANLGELVFQNGSAGLIYNNNGPIYMGTVANTAPSFTLLQSGNVGIGTTGPSYPLDVQKWSTSTPVGAVLDLIQVTTTGANTDDDTLIKFTHNNGGNARTWMLGTGSNTYFGHPDNFGIVDTLTTSVPFVIQRGTGDVGIGTTGPLSALSVSGGVAIGTTYAGTNAAGSNNLIVQGGVAVGTTSVGSYTLYVNGTAYATGAAGALSDIRHKKNVKDLVSGLAEVEQLRPVTFEWKSPTDAGMQGVQMGFIAQDVEKVLPTAVMTQDNAEKTKSMKYNELIAVLTKAVQELKALFDADHGILAKLQALFAADHDEIAKLKAANDNQAKAIEELRKDFETYKKAHP